MDWCLCLWTYNCIWSQATEQLVDSDFFFIPSMEMGVPLNNALLYFIVWSLHQFDNLWKRKWDLINPFGFGALVILGNCQRPRSLLTFCELWPISVTVYCKLSQLRFISKQSWEQKLCARSKRKSQSFCKVVVTFISGASHQYKMLVNHD